MRSQQRRRRGDHIGSSRVPTRSVKPSEISSVLSYHREITILSEKHKTILHRSFFILILIQYFYIYMNLNINFWRF